LGLLDSWNDGPTKSAIVEFVDRVARDVPPEQRVAVFDNDGTLWCEKPAYIQLDFLIRRLAEQAALDPSLASRQPYQAATEGDLSWFGDAVTRHYNGDDSAVKVLAAGILSAYAGLTVEEHAQRVAAFFAAATHPTLGRPYTQCGYAPMVELLRLHAPRHRADVRHPTRASDRQFGRTRFRRRPPAHHRHTGIPG
jgi:phosphoglycolate phosphatase-like HAD superfamily hydrolase